MCGQSIKKERFQTRFTVTGTTIPFEFIIIMSNCKVFDPTDQIGDVNFALHIAKSKQLVPRVCPR